MKKTLLALLLLLPLSTHAQTSPNKTLTIRHDEFTSDRTFSTFFQPTANRAPEANIAPPSFDQPIAPLVSTNQTVSFSVVRSRATVNGELHLSTGSDVQVFCVNNIDRSEPLFIPLGQDENTAENRVPVMSGTLNERPSVFCPRGTVTVSKKLIASFNGQDYECDHTRYDLVDSNQDGLVLFMDNTSSRISRRVPANRQGRQFISADGYDFESGHQLRYGNGGSAEIRAEALCYRVSE